MIDFLKRTWAEINLDALDSNIAEIRKLIGNKEIMAVVKANAYGHDDKTICTELSRLGVNYFAVSNIWEAEDLREIVPSANIIVFGYTEEPYLDSIIKNDIIHTAGSVEYAKRLSEFALSRNTQIRVHIKVNTGMTRIGIDSEEEMDEILAMEGLKCEGAYTHFAAADSLDESDVEYTKMQENKLLSIAKNKGLLIHSQNSGGILYHSDFEGDIVRAGVIMYGYMPNTACPVPMKLSPVMSVRSTVCQLKKVPKGTQVSYGRTYTADSEKLLAVIPVGYADGYSRGLSNNGFVGIRGKLAPICGRVCMDQIIVDVTNIEGVSVGDIAEIYSDKFPETTIDNIADKLGTIGYELVCNVGHRVPRVAVRNGKVTDVVRYG
ncbi:MAG: alanine racemase [Ruminiclostridium sp.]